MSTERIPCAPQRGRVLFFWDYDTQWGGDRSRTGGGKKNWGELEFVHTERLLELHAKYDIPACFAVVGSAALTGQRPYHDPEQIRRIHAAGHEIASHSHRHEWLPGLGKRELRETLSASKDALEQCISSPVVSFVPPYNQPFDYPAGMSFSVSERRAVRADRTGLTRLCEFLQDCGYCFCRVAYRPLAQRLKEKLFGKGLYNPVCPEKISSVCCLRLNTPCGFGDETRRLVERCSQEGGTAVVYGHPHSLHSGNPQDEKHLLPLVQWVSELRKAQKLQVCLPCDLLNGA